MYEDLASQAAGRYGIPADLFLRQIKQESGFDPRAVSKAGAQGLGQLMPGTAADLGVTDPFDPAQNLDGAARYMRQMYDKYGDWGMALAAYNAGPGTVDKYGGVPPFEETQNYLATIMGGNGANAASGTTHSGGNALGGMPEPEIANALAALSEPRRPEMPELWTGHDPAMFMRRRA
jgi:soluble lytic murein transglycosylase-like protein